MKHRQIFILCLISLLLLGQQHSISAQNQPIEEYISDSTTPSPSSIATGNTGDAIAGDCWHWQNSSPEENNTLPDVFFIDVNIGWIVGTGGLILKTTNGGTTWIPQSSGTTNNLNSVHFTTAQVGWVVGRNGTILKTFNGGASWSPQNSVTTASLNCVYFTEEGQTGWVVGTDGVILMTTNGGVTWLIQNSSTTNPLMRVHFTNNQNGWIIGNGKILKTTDGGSSWTLKNLGIPGSSGTYYSVYFIDSLNGWVVGNTGIYKTINGGDSWQLQNQYSTRDVFFIDNSTGWAVGNAGILKTTNGGSTWYSQNSGTQARLYGVHFTDNQTGWIVGEGNTKIKTNVGGSSWYVQTGVDYSLNDIFFTDDNIGYAVGTLGRIMKTTDGGITWTFQIVGTGNIYSSVYFINHQVGYITGYVSEGSVGVLLKTMNGGLTWQQLLTLGNNTLLLDVYFADNQNGWVVGSNATILKTTDGGVTWQSQNIGYSASLRSVHFIDNQTGWVVGTATTSNGVILKTTDGGVTWQSQNIGYSNSLRDVYFIDNQIGWVIGIASPNGIILKTINGGTSWLTQDSITQTVLNGVRFIDSLTGWVVGSGGLILNTTNGGSVWQHQAPGTTGFISNIYFKSQDTGWAVGASGAILKYGSPAKPLTQNISYCHKDQALPLTATGSNLLWYTTPSGGVGNPVAPTPNTTVVGTTTYYVSQTAIGSNGCGESERSALTVSVKPIPSATISSLSPSCTGLATGSVTISAAGGTPPYIYAWSNGQTTETATNLATGTYTVTITSEGCSSTTTAVIPGVTAPTAGFNYSVNFQTVTFSNVSSNATSYQWDFGNGVTSTLTDPIVTFANSGTYSVCLTSTGSCGSTSTCQAITITATTLLTVSPMAINVNSSAGSTNFSVTSNCGSWAVTGIPAWLTLTPTSGSNNGNIVLSFTKNEMASLRTATLTVTGCGANTVLIVTQDGVGASPWSIDSTGDNHTIILPANMLSDISGVPLQPGDQVGVFFDASGILKCGGYGVWQGSSTAFAAYGNDAPAPSKNGFSSGETFHLKIWSKSLGQEFDAIAQYAPVGTAGIVTHTNTFAKDGISMISSISAVTTATHAIALTGGWNMISSYVVPSMPDMLDIFSPISSSIDIVKDGAGTTTIPSFALNNIGNWNVSKGYQVKANKKDTLIIVGQKAVPEATQIPLQTGWQIIGYLRQSPQDIATVFASIQGQISIVKDNFGNTYLPQFGINTINDMKPGHGYKVKALSDANLVYQANLTGASSERNRDVLVANTVHFVLDSNINTGNNATIVLPKTIAEGLPLPGDEVGVFTPTGVLCGAAAYQDENMAITVWGDDATTNNIIEGMQVGEAYIFKVWNVAEQTEYISITMFVSGTNSYQPDAVEVISDMYLTLGVDILPIVGVQHLRIFPNPASEKVNIDVESTNSGKVNLTVYSSDGLCVLDWKTFEYNPGSTIYTLFLPDNLSDGLYWFKFMFENGVICRQVFLDK